ncbi:EscU/YscU/HrcU family type III secretion system export apparatus switch protein [Ruminiclostridium josui]|uniref:EscU/YscU/HrcU family type III secretion system export apparatus switch protein n=1 Tax=Ruminiclostridium josui TaxID=1499 RepID=UPI00046566F6|nr:EscU/YscU/HrcU family type III secretion system export apparatus switch protein [Ruminiclostridium josui]
MKEDNIKKQIKHAAALQYSPETDAAPRIVAAGKGQVAERIIQKAQESNIPLYQDNNLAQTLSSLSIGDEIPPEIYEVVAEILIFIGCVDESYGDLHDD